MTSIRDPLIISPYHGNGISIARYMKGSLVVYESELGAVLTSVDSQRRFLTLNNKGNQCYTTEITYG